MTTRREAKTVPVHELPTVLVVGSMTLAERCRDGAARGGAIVRRTDAANAAIMATTCRPLAIVANDTGGADRRTLEALTNEVESTLLLVADDVPADQLLESITGAIQSTRARRSNA